MEYGKKMLRLLLYLEFILITKFIARWNYNGKCPLD